MTYKSNSAVYALNSFTWQLLKSNLGWTEYQGVPLIIPTAQQPELMQSGSAFIVYGSAMQPAMHLYALNTESVAYNIYGKSTTEVNNVADLLFEVFKRQDEAAALVNDWLAKESLTRTGGHRGVYFGTVRATMIEKAEPADEEGGFVSALVMLETRYTADTPAIITSF
jgi:hypothetical protein